MKYDKAIAYLENLHKFGSKPGLHRIRKILAAFGNPHKKIKFVHVTGTNGKGSTSAIIASILRTAGYRVGLFTSPHLYKYNERIKINNKNISNIDFIKTLQGVKKFLDKNTKVRPALFEVLTAMAFLYFADKKIDIAVMEVGLGGRYDSTNVIDSLVSIITNIDIEHIEVLGNTRPKIAIEKAGIIKPDSTVITGERDKDIQNIFQKISKRKKADLLILDHKKINLTKRSYKGQIFDFKDLKDLNISLLGNHQFINASLAILCAEALNKRGFRIKEGHIRKGLKNAKWPLRLDLIHKSPMILIDVCHNLHGVKIIQKTIKDIFSKSNKILVLGCSYNKPYKRMAKALSLLSDRIIITKAKYYGAEQEEIMRSIYSRGKSIYQTKDVQEAMRLAKKISNKNSLIMALGGLYLGAETKEVVDKTY